MIEYSEKYGNKDGRQTYDFFKTKVDEVLPYMEEKSGKNLNSTKQNEMEGLLEKTSGKVLMQTHLYLRIATAYSVEQW